MREKNAWKQQMVETDKIYRRNDILPNILPRYFVH